jgi:hypothetical protein
MLGDSFVEGIRVQQSETFASLLQVSVDRAGLARRWQIINAASRATRRCLKLLYLRNGDLDLQPDLVVVNFDLSATHNDIQYGRLAEFNSNGDYPYGSQLSPRE